MLMLRILRAGGSACVSLPLQWQVGGWLPTTLVPEGRQMGAPRLASCRRSAAFAKPLCLFFIGLKSDATSCRRSAAFVKPCTVLHRTKVRSTACRSAAIELRNIKTRKRVSPIRLLRQLLRSSKHLVEHHLRQPTGECILLARMVARQQPNAAGKLEFSAVSELRRLGIRSTQPTNVFR